MEKYIPCKWKAKESWSSNPYINKIDLKIKKITSNKEGHYIVIKVSIQEEDITIVNIVGCIGAQHRSTSIHKTNTNRHKRRN